MLVVGLFVKGSSGEVITTYLGIFQTALKNKREQYNSKMENAKWQ